MPPEPSIHVVLIDPSGKVRSQEMAVLRAAGMDVHLVTVVALPASVPDVDVVVADLRPAEVRPGAVLRLAFEFQRPVVVVTGVTQVDARLAALRYGAADHVVAPTEARELIERVRHAAQRARARREAEVPDLLVDRAARTVRNGGRSAALTPAELSVLEVLMDRTGEVVTKAEIGEAMATRPRPNTVEVHVSALRRKLDSVGAPSIKTVHRRGYVFRAAPRVDRTTVRVADLVAQRQRLVRERDEHVRRRDEILQSVEDRRADGPRPPRPEPDGA